jgi:hypothetical protein
MIITAAYKNPCFGCHDRLARPCKGFRTLSKAKAKLTRVLAIAAVFGAVIADDVRADTPGLSYAFGSELPFVAGSAVVPLRAGGLALGDFNGDGKVDAAVPGTFMAGVASILTSGTANWVNAGPWPVAVAAADFSGDGYDDLVVCEQDGHGVAIYTNDGGGGFTRTAFYPTSNGSGPVGPQAVLPLDMDGNGKPDLVVANRFAETVVVLYNTGSGFVLGQTVPVSGEPNALVAADLYGRGRTDVAVACAADDTAKILKNVSGRLQPAGTFDAGPYPVAIAAADLNADGYVDLAAADREAPQVTVLLNDGMGQFTNKDVWLLAAADGPFEPPEDVQLADTNGDGRIDIRCAGVTLLNDGAGNFAGGTASGLRPEVYAETVLWSEPYPFLGMIYRPAAGAGWYFYGSIVSVSYQAPPPLNPVTGDINGDGQTDISDLLMLAASWATRVGETGFVPACDLDRDGGVDVTDLLILAANWGR